MNFKDEYRKSAESLSPDRKTIDRMKAAVMAEINSGAEENPRSRKPLLMNRIALIGGAAAACAVITMSAVAFIPMIRNNADMVNEAESASSSAAANNSYSDASNSSAVSAVSPEQGLNSVAGILDESDTITSNHDSGSDTANSEQYDPTDTDHSGNETDFPSDKTQQGEGLLTSDTTGASSTAPAESPDFSDGVTHDFSSNDDDEAAIISAEVTEVTDDGPVNPCTGADPEVDTAHTSETEAYTAEAADYPTAEAEYTSEFDFATAEATAELDEPNYTEEISYEISPDETVGAFEETAEVFEGTAEFVPEEYGTAEQSEEVQPDYQYRLVLTGKGWLTFNGDRYDQIRNAADPGAFGQAVQAVHITDGQMYSVYIDNDTIYLYQNNGKFLGAFVKKS